MHFILSLLEEEQRRLLAKTEALCHGQLGALEREAGETDTVNREIVGCLADAGLLNWPLFLSLYWCLGGHSLSLYFSNWYLGYRCLNRRCLDPWLLDWFLLGFNLCSERLYLGLLGWLLFDGLLFAHVEHSESHCPPFPGDSRMETRSPV